MSIMVPTNVKLITSGNVPTTDDLAVGELAFGKVSFDGKFHIFGNPGDPNNVKGTIVEFAEHIERIQIMVRADDKTVMQGSSVPQYTSSVLGLPAGKGLNKLPILSCDCDINQVGTYDIIASDALPPDDGEHYYISYKTGRLTVTPATYKLSITTSGQGTVTGSGTYKAGSTVNISATPMGGYIFLQWASPNGGSFGDPTSRITTFVMPEGDTTVIAAFTASSGGGGGGGSGSAD